MTLGAANNGIEMRIDEECEEDVIHGRSLCFISDLFRSNLILEPFGKTANLVFAPSGYLRNC
jgi:hypothetical protein